MTASLAAALLICSTAIAQMDKPTQAPIVSASLFKNGLVMVRRSFDATRDGAYVLGNIPKPVLGTYWIDSKAHVVTRVRVPVAVATYDPFIGQQVKILFEDSSRSPVSGTMERVGRLSLGEFTSGFGEEPILAVRTATGPAYPGKRTRCSPRASGR